MCTDPPCSPDGKELCVLPPCEKQGDVFACKCMTMSRPALWREPDEATLRTLLENIVDGNVPRTPSKEAMQWAHGHCWQKRGLEVERRMRLLSQNMLSRNPHRRIVVSLTTNPLRIYKLQPVLRSLCYQTIDVAVVYVFVPFLHQRTFSESQIPAFFEEFQGCIEVRHVVDAGPVTKLLAVMQVETHSQSMIVTVDDDQLYPLDMIETLLGVSNQHAHKIVTAISSSSTDDTMFCMYQGCTKPTLVSNAQLEGFAGVLYPRGLLGTYDEFQQFTTHAHSSCTHVDDVLISAWLSLRNVSIVTPLLEKSLRPTGLYEDDTGLHKEGTNGEYRGWHPEEMRKNVACLKHDGAASNRRAIQLRTMMPQTDGACQRWCYRFQDACAQGKSCKSTAEFYNGMWRDVTPSSVRGLPPGQLG